MTNEEQLELAELKAQSKLKPKEKARLKILERKANKLEQEEKTEKESKSHNRSVFAVQPTTEIPPTPVRYTEAERTVLRTLADDVKAVSQEQVKAVLGKISEINETKLIRASVLLLRKHSDAEVIDAIVAVKRSDLERKMANTNVFGLLKKEEEKIHLVSLLSNVKEDFPVERRMEKRNVQREGGREQAANRGGNVDSFGRKYRTRANDESSTNTRNLVKNAFEPVL